MESKICNIFRGVYSSIIRPKRWGISFSHWGRISSFAKKKRKLKRNFKKYEKNNKTK